MKTILINAAYRKPSYWRDTNKWRDRASQWGTGTASAWDRETASHWPIPHLEFRHVAEETGLAVEHIRWLCSHRQIRCRTQTPSFGPDAHYTLLQCDLPDLMRAYHRNRRKMELFERDKYDALTVYDGAAYRSDLVRAWRQVNKMASRWKQHIQSIGKTGWSAQNVSIYGVAMIDGHAWGVVQVRHAEKQKSHYYTNVKKAYYLVGPNTRIEVPSATVRSAIRKNEAAESCVIAARDKITREAKGTGNPVAGSGPMNKGGV